MKQVDFYLISNRVAHAKLKLASRLSNKLQRLGQRALIITNNSSETDKLDALMWSFSDASFLAHDRLDAEQTSDSAMIIGDHDAVNAAVLEKPFDVLINLCDSVPLYNHHFARIAEIVEADEAAKATARLRYTRYNTEGFELKTHEIEL